MMPTNPNLLKGHELALSISTTSQCTSAQSSANWFIKNSNTNIAIWANDSSVSTGCITSQLYSELNHFLDRATSSSVERIILFIDSAGVQLNQGWQAMKHTANLIKKLLHIRIHHQITTIAVLGNDRGCFGGAYLLASCCQYVLGTKNGQYGVSGKKVIEHLNCSKDETSQLFYQAPYRLINQEIFCIVPDPLEERRNLLLMLEHHPLTSNELLQEFITLKASADEDNLAIHGKEINKIPNNDTLGFPVSEKVGCDDLLYFCNQLIGYLDLEKPLPLIMGNCEQEFSFINEQRGFSRYLALCIKLLRYLSENHQEVRVKVDQHGSGATFIAVSMMADTLIIEEGSCIYPLPLDAMHLFLKHFLPKGDEWKNHHKSVCTI